jgi:hypothetical protein
MMDKLNAILKDLEKEIKDLQILIGCSKETIVICAFNSSSINAFNNNTTKRKCSKPAANGI